MATSVDQFIERVSAAWPLGNERAIPESQKALADVANADVSEPWLAGLLAERPATRELCRHETYGFMLLAHTENQGLYRAPHDHGRAWVVYAVQSGELEIGTYRRTQLDNGEVGVIETGRSVLGPGMARVYLPGEIHDTCCLSETALLLRFTERDLRHEDLVEGKVTRFVKRDGQWIGTMRTCA